MDPPHIISKQESIIKMVHAKTENFSILCSDCRSLLTFDHTDLNCISVSDSWGIDCPVCNSVVTVMDGSYRPKSEVVLFCREELNDEWEDCA